MAIVVQCHASRQIPLDEERFHLWPALEDRQQRPAERISFGDFKRRLVATGRVRDRTRGDFHGTQCE